MPPKSNKQSRRDDDDYESDDDLFDPVLLEMSPSERRYRELQIEAHETQRFNAPTRLGAQPPRILPNLLAQIIRRPVREHPDNIPAAQRNTQQRNYVEQESGSDEDIPIYRRANPADMMMMEPERNPILRRRQVQAQQRQQQPVSDDDDRDRGAYDRRHVEHEADEERRHQARRVVPVRGAAARRAAANNGEPNGRIRNGNGTLLRAQNWIVTFRTDNPAPNMVGNRCGPGNSTLDYMCGQMEIGRNPGNTEYAGAHWQGYMEFSGPVTATQIIAMTGWRPGSVHLEPRWGSQQQAIDYTKKLDTNANETLRETGQEDLVDPRYDWTEYGTKHAADAPGQALMIRDAILQGHGMKEFLHDNNLFGYVLRCHKGVERFIQEHQDDDEECDNERNVRVVVYYGEGRTGKSGTVYRRHGFKTVFKKGREASQHFTGYNKHPVLLLEEFGQKESGMTPAMVQEWLDPYPCNIKVMYGQRKAKWNTVYLCSNIAPIDWFPGAPESVRKAIQERIHEVWRFTKDAIYLEKGTGDFTPIPDPKIRPAPSIITQPMNNQLSTALEHRTGIDMNLVIPPSHPQAHLLRTAHPLSKAFSPAAIKLPIHDDNKAREAEETKWKMQSTTPGESAQASLNSAPRFTDVPYSSSSGKVNDNEWFNLVSDLLQNPKIASISDKLSVEDLF